MGQFVGEIDLQVLPGESNLWEVKQAFQYITDNAEPIVIQEGLKTDLASTPRIIWNIYPPFGLYTGAAIVHDDLYSTQIYTRARSDAVLLEAMKTEGVNGFTRWVIYTGVRVGGWLAWRKRERT